MPESRMVGTLTDEERSKIEKSHMEFKHFIKIPRRYYVIHILSEHRYLIYFYFFILKFIDLIGMTKLQLKT